MDQEKRSFPRFHFLGPKRPLLKVRLTGEKEISGQLVNISTGGLRLKLKTGRFPLPGPGEEMFLSTQLFTDHTMPSSPMKVCYSQPSKDQKTLILGLDFYPSRHTG